LNLVYDRVEGGVPNLVTKVKLCLKGIWKFATEAQEEKDKVFLYQKVSPIVDEELLIAYFMTQPNHQRINQRLVQSSQKLDLADDLSVQ
jgi:hypothetical protein